MYVCAYLYDILQVHDAEKDLEAAQEKLNLQGLRMLSVRPVAKALEELKL